MSKQILSVKNKMSVMIIDKETNKRITVSTSEASNRGAPSVSGTGMTQDPVIFFKEFDKATKWNNWRNGDRKKGTFLLCLSGNTERWYKSKSLSDPTDFSAITFEDDGEAKGILSLFKEQYITEEWYEYYTTLYEDRKQTESETPTDYLESKRYLFQRAGEDCREKSIKQ
ncbi:hypothetical protein MFLAVUS_002386 [Mucor flavus]|uniref:Uncharacterized protein n=1 Tax=Mucor flavus TaxID=439312 RepID=A0ABP9YQ50_9FUNG